MPANSKASAERVYAVPHALGRLNGCASALDPRYRLA
jgi:hypothetical protein